MNKKFKISKNLTLKIKNNKFKNFCKMKNNIMKI